MPNQVIYPRKADGSAIHVNTFPDGRVYVDVKPEQAPCYGKLISRYSIGDYVMNRGGPEHSQHFHRWEDYGLADGLVRCRKCGLVAEPVKEPK